MNAIYITKKQAKHTIFAKMPVLIIACAISTNAMGHDKMCRDGQLFYLLNECTKTAEVISPKWYEDPEDEHFILNKPTIIEEYKRMTEVNIPAEVRYEDITYKVTGIGYKAFGHCGNLESVTLPASLSQIENDAFCHCYKLTKVTCYAKRIPCLGDCFFTNTDEHKVFTKDEYSIQDTLYVPQKSLKKYKKIPEWRLFKVILPIEENH